MLILATHHLTDPSFTIIKTIVGAHLSLCGCPSTHKSIQIDTHGGVSEGVLWVLAGGGLCSSGQSSSASIPMLKIGLSC